MGGFRLNHRNSRPDQADTALKRGQHMAYVQEVAEAIHQAGSKRSPGTPRVQSTIIEGIDGFYTRNRNDGFRWIPCSWVLGPLG